MSGIVTKATAASIGAVTTLTADDLNTITPTAGDFVFAGGVNLSSVAVGSTVTYNLTGTTDHALQLGNATGSLTSLLGTSNTALLGVTGLDPIFGTIPNAVLDNSSVTLNSGNNVTVTGSPLSLGGTAVFALSGTTLNAVQIGNASGALTSLTLGLTNTALLGSTGASPFFGQLPNDALVNNDITLNDGDNITVTGSPISLGDSGTIALSGMTEHSLQVGSASGSLTNLGVAANGQLPIGAATADPVLATLTGGQDILVANLPGSITLNLDIPIPVPSGGTGLPSITDHSLLLGSGTGDLTELGVAADGELVIGSAGVDPVLATITAGLASQVDNAAGSITVGLTVNDELTAIHGWNGYTIENSTVTVTAAGGVITLSIEKSGGGNLTAIFFDGYFEWVTAPDTITLTAGSDISPQINYIYLLQSTKVLTVNTSDFPSAEHIPVAVVLCQSAASLQTDGPYKMHAWTDHVENTVENSHLSHLSHWIRHQQATWKSGVVPTLTINAIPSPDTVIFTSSSGEVSQLHEHTFPAFTGTPDIYVVNNFAVKFVKITDLNTQLIDSLNVSMANKYFSLVIWGVVNQSTGDCKLMCNLPGGSYNTQSGLIADASKYTNFSIPSDFIGVGFLIAQLQLRHQAAAGGTWTEIDTIDLRGLIPSVAPGGSTAAQTEFIDNTFRILDEGDETKEIAFEASGISASTTRTLTVQDASGTIALSGVANFGTGVQSNTAYAVLCGGTTSTNPIQSIATVGTAAEVFTSNGAGALPTFQAAAFVPIPCTEVAEGQSMTVNNSYITNSGGLLTMTLPATAAVGTIIEIVGKGAGGWTVAQNAGQTIHKIGASSTTGAGGSVASSAQFDSIEMKCITANTDFVIVDSEGVLTIV